MNRRTAVLGGGVALLASATLLWLWLAKTPRPEVVPVPIPLSGGPELAEAEISGLAWVGDSLVLLPQYPESFDGSVFVIDRAEIERVLSDPDGDPIAARRVPLDAPALEEALPGFDGFEAIAVDDGDVFVTVETRRGRGASSGYILAGRVEGDLERIVIDPTRRAELPPQNDLVNTSYEALVVQGDRVLAIYETNGEVNPAPRALVFNRSLEPLEEMPMPAIEYRITDATTADEQGRFWVANYHWPGAPWAPGACSITERYGQGESHSRCRTVERIVELQLTETGVRLTDRAPVLLSLVDDQHARNWEGLVRMPGRGFLMMTDEHPASILAFVPDP